MAAPGGLRRGRSRAARELKVEPLFGTYDNRTASVWDRPKLAKWLIGVQKDLIAARGPGYEDRCGIKGGSRRRVPITFERC